ncbi:MAG: hypothetical protein PHG20_06200 [Geobacteraceae bacterium]|nr:hypothetical protein [Geobacteraceae bacterium]
MSGEDVSTTAKAADGILGWVTLTAHRAWPDSERGAGVQAGNIFLDGKELL